MRAILVFMITGLTILPVSLGVFYITARSAILQQNHLIQSRGRELAATLSAQAGENFTAKGFVQLSAIMNRIVKEFVGRTDQYEIEQIALLDRKSRTRAHSNIARAARDEKSVFDEKKYEATLYLPRHAPIRVNVLESIAPSDPLMIFLQENAAFLPRLLPGFRFAGNRYHVGAAVYRPDSKKASGRLHIIIRIRSQESYIQDLKLNLLYIIPGSLFVTILLSLMTNLILYRKPGPASVPAEPTEESTEVTAPGSAAVLPPVPPEKSASIDAPVVLDALPLDEDDA